MDAVMVSLSRIRPMASVPRFGMIELMLPVDANQFVPNTPRDDWGIARGNAMKDLFQRMVDTNAFKPDTMDQLMYFPGMDIPVYKHPYSSPDGNQEFIPDDLNRAVFNRFVPRGNALRVFIDETQLPYNTLLQVLHFYVRASQQIAGKPLQYKVTDTELQPLYELAIVLLGRKIFPDAPAARPVATDNTSPPETA